MDIITEKITFGGNSLGKIDGKNVFVPYAIPGEKYEVNIVETKRDYDRAEIVKILEKSEHRVEPKCKYYGKCGGCNMMHIDSAYQTELRKNILSDIFMQNGIDVKDKINVVTGPDFNYRARFQFTDGGLSQRSGNVIIPVTGCECAEKTVNDWLASMPVDNRQKGRIHVFGSEFVCSEQPLTVATIKEKQQTQIINKTKKKIKIKENHYFAGTVASPENSMTVKLNGKNLTFDVRGFFQSNLYVFQKVLNLICDSLGNGDNVLDMYAGCGSISTFLADKFNNVVLVEHNRDALVYAEQNMAGTKHISYGMSGANWVTKGAPYCGSFDACVIDPPRSGMEKEVRDYLCSSGIPQIRSLSCDPATHARDCKKLIEAGYSLEELYLLDFYPNTSHIESLAVFVKA